MKNENMVRLLTDVDQINGRGIPRPKGFEFRFGRPCHGEPFAGQQPVNFVVIALVGLYDDADLLRRIFFEELPHSEKHG